MKSVFDVLLETLKLDDTIKFEPTPDLYYCPNCEKEFHLSDCDSGTEGDYENGYYVIHWCPNCGNDDGDYIFSEERYREWEKWKEK